MTKIIVLTLLALITMTCAILEGLVPSLPAQFIQVNGLLTILCASAFIVGVLKIQAEKFNKD